MVNLCTVDPTQKVKMYKVKILSTHNMVFHITGSCVVCTQKL